MDMKAFPAGCPVNDLFVNTDPAEVWNKLERIVGRMDPVYDFSLARTAFDDVTALFRGDYPGYSAIRTLYHDQPHTLDVLLCAVRLMHGLHVSGQTLDAEDITLAMIACLMHDVGYAQTLDDHSGTGAQYTQCHVTRSIGFMHSYLAARPIFPAGYAARLEPVIRCTDPGFPYAQIAFPDERARLLGQIVGTADLVGQMADRTYLEKLLFLFLEFREAHFGNYRSTYDMLRQTQNFYENARQKLDGPFGGLYRKLASHFREMHGVEEDCYLISIEKNIAYLADVTALGEANYLSMLKRGGIVEKSRHIAMPE